MYPDKIFGAPGSVLLSAGTVSYNSFQTQLSRAFSKGLVYNFTYTYSRARGLALCGGDFNVCVQNPYNLAADRGPTNLDIPNVFTFNTAYELPFGKGRRYLTSGPAAYLAGGWQVNSIVTARSGQVINPSTGIDYANIGGGTQRFSFASDPNSNAPHTISSYFNLQAFRNPAPGTFGNAGLNSLRGPGFWNADLSLFKEFPIYERATFQFRAEAFDVFNHPNLANPALGTISTTTSATGSTANVYSSGFNTITSTVGNSNRVIQLAGKLLF